MQAESPTREWYHVARTFDIHESARPSALQKQDCLYRSPHLIPREERLPLVIKLHKQGRTSGEIRYALGWRDNNGSGMVKSLMIEAGLR